MPSLQLNTRFDYNYSYPVREEEEMFTEAMGHKVQREGGEKVSFRLFQSRRGMSNELEI